MVGFAHGDLVVPGKHIREVEQLVTYYCIDELVYPGKKEAVFWASFIQVYVVYTDLPLVIGFLEQDHVHTPVRIAHFVDKTRVKQLLHFFVNCLIPLWVESPPLLDNRLMFRV